MKKVELLAPCGDLECLKMAVNNGADAIYLGGQNFSARAYANNFTNDEIVEGINYAHIRNVKVYASINTLVYDDEINSVLEFVDFLYLHQIDGLIVADFGLINLLKDRYLDLAIHVSTQLNTTSLWQIKMLEELGVKRVVLARETPLETIKNIVDNTNLEIEVFVHGALCVCYSGNCLHSSLIGKRSGNRGKCAQPCRMEYTLLENNVPVSNKKYLLSTKDLNTLDNINEIIDSGVTSLKIEGRMKNKEYVGLVVSSYRQAIDAYYQNKTLTNLKQTNLKLQSVFSREFTSGYILNDTNSNISNTYRPSHLGLKVGQVVNVKDHVVVIKLSDKLAQKDKITIVSNKLDDVKLYVSKINKNNKLVPCGYKNEIIEISVNSKVTKGSFVYKTIDNNLLENIDQTLGNNLKKIPISMEFYSKVSKPMILKIKDIDNNIVAIKSQYIVEKALNCPTTKDKINEQLTKLQNSSYSLKNLQINSDELGIIPIKYLNELRREALIELDQKRLNKYQRSLDNLNLYPNNILKNNPKIVKNLKVKVQNIKQLEAIASLKEINCIYYEDYQTYPLACQKYPHLNIILVLPRILDNSKNYSSLKYVINNYGDLLKYESTPKIADLYLNITNKYTIYQLSNYNIESFTLSCELNYQQIKDLINDLLNDNNYLPPLEMVVYGRYQTMISNYCPISKEYGHERKHCGACKNKNFALLDRLNYVFPITTNDNCQITIYNSKALSLIDYCNDLYDLGISSLRLDFSIESPEEVLEITKAFIAKINNQEINYVFKDVTYGYFQELEKN